MRQALILVTGLIVGGALVYLLFIGVPSAKPIPGEPLKAPETAGQPPGTAVLTLDEKFFGTVLSTVFSQLGNPKFPLQLTAANNQVDYTNAQDGCRSEIVLTPEGSGAKTSVKFVQGKIMAPLAFSGSYNAFGSCINFKGWAQTSVSLLFDAPRQTLYGNINVEGVNLEGIAPVVSGIVTPLVQRAINDRVNPLELLKGSQLSLSLPVVATGGMLKANVKDTRAEIKDNSLRLHIIYEFMGERQAAS
jgi:hypothetical protein